MFGVPVGDPSVLEDVASLARDGRGQPVHIFDRVELRLVVPAHRRENREGEAGVPGQVGGKTERLRDLDLFLDVRHQLAVASVSEGGHPLDVGVEAVSFG